MSVRMGDVVGRDFDETFPTARKYRLRQGLLPVAKLW